MAVIKCVKNTIRNRDIFGHPVLLNFNKRGDTHNTVIGGCMSIFVIMFLLYYLGIHVKKMVLYEDDKISSKESSMTNEESQNTVLNYKDSKYMRVIYLMDGRYNLPLPYDNTAKKHVTISAY